MFSVYDYDGCWPTIARTSDLSYVSIASKCIYDLKYLLSKVELREIQIIIIVPKVMWISVVVPSAS
jgi:hypothetical protein